MIIVVIVIGMMIIIVMYSTYVMTFEICYDWAKENNRRIVSCEATLVMMDTVLL